ncbi:MAG: ComEC/Rec2 family competence protein [Nibricoccus sp.]
MESSFNTDLTPESAVRGRQLSTQLPRCLRHRAPVLWLLLPFIGGLVIGHVAVGVPAPIWLLATAALLLGVTLIFSRRPLVWGVGLILGLLLAGAGYYEVRRHRLSAWDALPMREAKLTLRVERTFTPSADGKRVSGLAQIIQADAHLNDLVGQRLYFSLARRAGEIVPIRSSEISVVGILQTLPRQASAGSFEGYLVNQGLNFRLNRGRVLAQTAPPTAYRKFCDNARERLSSFLSIGLGKHPDLAAISRAMLLGLQQELTEEQNQWFMRSGTMHLFSISGLHIAVIALALDGLLGLFRLPRVARFVLSAVLLWFYVDITGTAPSAVRAYLMVVLLQASFVLRLPINPIAALSFAALGALVVDPMQLFTASFQMSYGIVAALLLLGLPLGEFWCDRWQLFRFLPKATWSWWQRMLDVVQRWSLNVLAIGISTALVSTISGVIYFGLFTPGSLLANLVLIPVGSLVILSGFISMLCGLAGLTTLCSLFNHASALVLLGCERGIDYFLKVPGMFRTAQFSRGWSGFVIFGVLLATLLWGYGTRWENKRGGIWPPFVVTALALIFAIKYS